MFTFFGRGRSTTRTEAPNAALLDSIHERDVVRQKAQLDASITREEIDRINDKLLQSLAELRKVQEERDHLRILLDARSAQLTAEEQEVSNLLDVFQETVNSQGGGALSTDRTLKDVGVLTDPVNHTDHVAGTVVVRVQQSNPSQVLGTASPDSVPCKPSLVQQLTKANRSVRSQKTVEVSSPLAGRSSGESITTVASCMDSNIPIPEARRAAIADAQIIPDLEDDGQVCFSRPFLSQHLGGGPQVLIVKIANPRPLSAQLMDSYLCPNLWENPWCPKSPGMSGYMFVGLGAETTRFCTPETHHLFVGVARGQYMLMGLYEATRVEPLTTEEWKALPFDMQVKYSETTQRKNKDPRPVDAIRRAYNNGGLRVPCVKLNCLDFNETLYRRLRAIQKPSKSVLTKRGSTESRIVVPLKLRKVDEAG